jgi:hypothetical protein
MFDAIRPTTGLPSFRLERLLGVPSLRREGIVLDRCRRQHVAERGATSPWGVRILQPEDSDARDGAAFDGCGECAPQGSASGDSRHGIERRR